MSASFERDQVPDHIEPFLFPNEAHALEWKEYKKHMSEMEYLHSCKAHIRAEYWARLPDVLKGPEGDFPGWLMRIDDTKKAVILDEDEEEGLRIINCFHLEDFELEKGKEMKKSPKVLNMRDLSNHAVILNGHLCIIGAAVCTCGSRSCYLGSNGCVSHSNDKNIPKGKLFLPVKRGVNVLTRFGDSLSPLLIHRLEHGEREKVTWGEIGLDWVMLYDIDRVGDSVADMFAIHRLESEADYSCFARKAKLVSQMIEYVRSGARDNLSESDGYKPNAQEQADLHEQKVYSDLVDCDVPKALDGALEQMKQGKANVECDRFTEAASKYSKAIATLIHLNQAFEKDVAAQRMMALCCVDRLYCKLKRNCRDPADKAYAVRDAQMEFMFCLGFLDSQCLPLHTLQRLHQNISTYLSLLAIKTGSSVSQKRKTLAKIFQKQSYLDYAGGVALLDSGFVLNDDECPICAKEWKSVTSDVTLLPCEHAVCKACLRDWIQKRPASNSKEITNTGCVICNRGSLSRAFFSQNDNETHPGADSVFEQILQSRCAMVSSALDLQRNAIRLNESKSGKSFAFPVGLLRAIADPTTRGSAFYRCASNSSPKDNCDEHQNMVIDGLDKELEGIQGPPGTGKSETIVNVIIKRIPPEELVLVSAAQNKAVEALAIKLEQRNVPFIVMGTEYNDKLGPTALKFLLSQQIENHPDVEKLKVLLDTIKKDKSKDEKAYQDKRMRLMKDLQHTKDKVQRVLLFSARVVLGTIGACQHLHKSWHHPWRYGMPSSRAFKTIILDEAGCIPEYRLPVLIALKPDKLLLVGDHKQLEPFSAITNDTARSSLQRFADVLEEQGQVMPMLKRQYRMHPSISWYVSKYFYGGMLKTDEQVLMNRLHYSALSSPGKMAPGILWIDYEAQNIRHEKKMGTSRLNLKEVELTMSAIHGVISLIRARERGENVMVITFYQAQADAIAQAIGQSETSLAAQAEGVLRVVTVDGAQGSEANYVILSTVCCNSNKNIGFLNEPSRICVATSRAKDLLLVVGHSKTFLSIKNNIWAELVKASTGRQGCTLKEAMDPSMLRRIWHENRQRVRWCELSSRLVERWQTAPAQFGMELLFREDMAAFGGTDVVRDREDLQSAFQGPEPDDFM